MISGAAAAEAPLRFGLIGGDEAAAPARAALRAGLAGIAGLEFSDLPADAASARWRDVAAVIMVRGPGAPGSAEAARWAELLRSRPGPGWVILGATAEAWGAAPGLLAEWVGATPGVRFAGGAPMTVINLFAHPILAGVPRFETTQPMTAFSLLADDAQMIMEGTVGEQTTPLGWVRRRPGGRICHLVPAEASVLEDPAYLRIVSNALHWVSGRPISGAQPAVQRTFLPNSRPGAFAITFPEGPGVCLDPVRGGINYIWAGDFVDLRPRWLTKQGEPARIQGEVFYAEKAWRPLRISTPAGEPDFHFRGYALKAGDPEFHYVVAGRDVFETLRASPGGNGIVRHFRVQPGPGPLWVELEPQAGAEVTLRGVERDGDRACFPATGAGEFTIEIRRKQAGGGR